MKRKYKRLIFRIIGCLVAFVLAVLAAFFFTHRKVVENIEAVEISESTLPVIEVQTGGSYLNLMCGYTDDMIDRYMRGAVTPLPADRQLKIRIIQGDEIVKGIRFEVRSLDSTELLENTRVSEWKEKKVDTKSIVTAVLPIQNLLEKDREYKLTIYLETEHHEEICYFTRVISSEKLSTAKMVDFVKNFHNKTLDSANASGMAVYLRSNTDTSASLGFVSLNSSYSKLLWNYLNPKEIKDSTLEIIDINQTIGTFLMNSSVRFKDANGLDHDCDVEEVFTVQLSNGSWYMLNYERTANESIEREELRNGSSSLPLGIIHEEEVHVLNSEKGLCQALVVNGELWENYSNELEEAKLIKVFDLKENAIEAKAVNHSYDIKLISVGDEGNCSFIVYGYMNSGNHEGEIGLAFYEYDPINNWLVERFYLPFDRSYDILKEEIGKLTYVNKNGLFYLMLNGKIYAIDFSGKEYMTIVEDVEDDALAISNGSSVIAWEEDREPAGARTIQVLYLENGHQNTVTASEGEYIHVLGFIGNDLAVGKIKEADYQSYGGDTAYPAYAMDIVDETGRVAATYEKEKIMITGASVENGSIILKRSKVTSMGLRETNDDAMIENVNQISQEDESLYAEKSADGYLRWNLRVYCGSKDLTDVNHLVMSDSSYLKIALVGLAEEDMYFAYAKGRLQGVYSNISDAVAEIYDDIGYVTDSDGHYVFRRGYRTYGTIGFSSSLKAAGKKASYDVCLQAFAAFEGGSFTESFAEMEEKGMTRAEMLQRGINQSVCDLTGSSVSRMVYYYISQGHPLYAETKNGAILIIGTGSDTVYYWSPVTGSITNISFAEADKMIMTEGNVLISCRD